MTKTPTMARPSWAVLLGLSCLIGGFGALLTAAGILLLVDALAGFGQFVILMAAAVAGLGGYGFFMSRRSF